MGLVLAYGMHYSRSYRITDKGYNMGKYLIGQFGMHKKVFADIVGAHTNRPYQVFTDAYGFGVSVKTDDGWEDTADTFETEKEALAWIKKHDLVSDLEMMEIKYNVQ